MHDRIENQYLNRSTPTATARLIETFFENRLFASKYKKFLIRIMTETSTGQDKLKGLLPPDCTVGHKTALPTAPQRASKSPTTTPDSC